MEKRVTQALTIDKKVYHVGVHNFDEAAVNHPHFDFYQKAGYIVSPKTDKNAPAPQVVAQRKAMEEKYAIPKPAAQVAPIEGEPEKPAKKGKK